MNKLWLIIKREYTTRVFKKSFILLTLLVPLGIVAFGVLVGYIMSRNSVQNIHVAISDPQGMIEDSSFKSKKDIDYSLTKESFDQLKTLMKDGQYQAVIEIAPPSNLQETNFKIKVNTDERLDINTSESIKSTISKLYRNYKIKKLNLSDSTINNLDADISLDRHGVFKDDAKISNASNAVGAILGGIMGLLMYIFVLTQGMMVMRSVMEEKMNRIIEVILSSVKPIQLMMGKIIGVGFVGLTQLMIWLIFMPLTGIITGTLFSSRLKPQVVSSMDPNTQKAMEQAADQGLSSILSELGHVHWWFIVPMFLLFFVGGYFLFAAICAAIGSAVGDDQGESQQIMMPFTLLIVMGLYLAMGAIRAPNSSLSVISSFIPFFSPMVMSTRLAFDPPMWQPILALVILILTCIFFAFLAARIYRTGILMYGKKASFKELGKWMFSK